MKKNVIKTAIAAVCVVAAGFSGMKVYNNANQSEADFLLAENVEALSSGEYYGSWLGMLCPEGGDGCTVEHTYLTIRGTGAPGRHHY